MVIDENYKPKISQKNKCYADLLRKLISEYNVIGVIDVTNLPAPQFQEIRDKLRGRARVLIVKKDIIRIVLSELEQKYKNINQLIEKIEGICGLIFTNENPFKLYKFLQQNKSEAPAKAGQKAPREIWVKAGPTNFAPGPIIGELGSLKIKAGIEGGKVAIKEDALVAKEDEVISEKLAEILTRLSIKPMEVGLNVKAIYEDKIVYERNVLEIDENYYLDMIKSAASESFALSIGLNYYTKENIKYFISKSFKDSLSLAVGVTYLSKDVIDKIISKAYFQAVSLTTILPQEIVPPEVKNISEVSSSNSNNKDNDSNVNSNTEDSDNNEDNEEKGDVATGLGSLFG